MTLNLKSKLEFIGIERNGTKVYIYLTNDLHVSKPAVIVTEQAFGVSMVILAVISKIAASHANMKRPHYYCRSTSYAIIVFIIIYI